MNEVSGLGPSLQGEMFAVKKANETQAVGLEKILESTKLPQQDMQNTQVASQLTGIGQQLDIRA
ncbi:MAG: hypothetical protein U9N42_07370 [Campylobacterota bacterium]|nr:hypothetical protein [Campylobacterota bacterium]